ncbi:MAG: hypothetical protein ACRDKJ_09215 [Actinomycetota bacterium]
MGTVRRFVGPVIVGALLVSGLAYAGASAMTASDEVSLAQSEDPAPEEGTEGRRPGRHRFGLRSAIRGEFVVRGEEEGTFRRVRLDRGVIESISGSTVVVKEEDGTTVEIPTSDETRISRDGEEVELGALQAGDHVATSRVNDGDGFVTRSVRAFSPERWAEMEERREQCRENPERCRAERRERMMERRNAPPAAEPAADAAA